MPIPEKIKNAPVLFQGLEFYFNAFFDLDTCRLEGFGGIGSIPWTATNDYCNRVGLTDEQAEDMFYHIRKLDDAYRQHRASKS